MSISINSPIQPGYSEPTFVALERAGYLIDQIAEDFSGGKLSCALTTQLNANIALGYLDTFTALDVQEELCFDPKFDQYWSYGCDSINNPDGRAWKPRPTLMSELVLLNRGVALAYDVQPVLPSHDGTPRENLDLVLKAGAVAYVGGRSIVASHARLIFSTVEFPDKIFVHDPNYSNTTGLYDYDDLPSFYTSGIPWAYFGTTSILRTE